MIASPLRFYPFSFLRSRRTTGSGLLAFGGTLAALLVLLAAVGPLLSPYGYNQQDLRAGAQFQAPSPAHWLGTDDLGRDLFTRLAVGARVSLGIGFGVVLIELVVGLLLGLLAGYFGGRIDTLIMRVTDVMFAFPDLLLAIFIASMFTVHSTGFTANLVSIFVALGIVAWPAMTRLVRGQALALRNREFVEAARTLGATDFWILSRHVTPNLLAPVTVALATGMAGAILAESTLSFLGIGIQPPYPSWGSMISTGMTNIRSHPEQALIPAVVLALAVLGFNFLADGLRDRFDPRMRGV
ncbi:MAG: ABC transporter permease [Armatimonadetes bacterium]|nr:ABC transporter permease [Armatimonadota bacterium]